MGKKEGILRQFQEYKTQMITYKDENYPIKLKNIKDFPYCLFYKGNLDLINRKTIAIIGSRKCSEYGKNITKKLAQELAKRDIIVVTGGARGIDSYANIGALIAKRPSIIVLGNSLDYIYPPENKRLEELILNNGGLIVSEYLNQTRGNKMTFPERNRIISAISDGILIVEAKRKSGALITADLALEQGKEVYAVPGNILQLNSEGTNELIKQGAKVVTDVNDILEDY